jgi:hypothetical protein
MFVALEWLTAELRPVLYGPKFTDSCGEVRLFFMCEPA